MNAAEDDKGPVLFAGGVTGKFQRVAGHVGKLVNGFLLVVMAENEQTVVELVLAFLNTRKDVVLVSRNSRHRFLLAVRRSWSAVAVGWNDKPETAPAVSGLIC